MRKEMLINVSQPEECRIAILEDGVLEELYTERASQNNFAGNIYKGKIVNLEPSIQAAFVDFGVGRNGFLHISDVEPQYFRQAGYDPEEIMDGNVPGADIDDGDGDDEAEPARRRRRPMRGARPRFKPPIQEIFRRGDEVLVQVIKEGIGSKGPTLSTYISIPGRYLVLMPALGRVGVSRKIEDEKQRRELRHILLELNPPKGLGFIVRTAGQERTKRELSRDMAYLLRLWKVLVKRVKNTPSPSDIYEESDMIIRTIRDIFTEDIDLILVDEQQAFERAKEFLQLVMPRYVNRLKLYDGREPLFHKYALEKEIAKIHCRTVPLKGGGSIVIDPTEALVAIDVNSGSFRTDDSAEETAFQLNMAASKEIARQLRLRDLGGVIVNDFIDMRRETHRRKVERSLRDAMRRDRARTKILRTSPFGLIEMTRQRIRPGLKRSVYEDCPCCQGRAVVKTGESMAIEVVRILMMACQQPRAARVTIRVNDKVAAYLNNRKRRNVIDIEEMTGVSVQILGSEGLFPEHLECDCRDAEGNMIPLAFLSEAQQVRSSMRERKRTILVTGTAGFIGFHLARTLLARGETVVGLDNVNDYYSVQLKRDRLKELDGTPGYSFHEIELADRRALHDLFEQERFERVVHLAAQAGVRYSLTNPAAYIDSNLVGFGNILEACRQNAVGHLLYASSSSVYGSNKKQPFSIHDSVDHPVSLYAATKKANELMAHTYSHLYQLPTTGLRFFTVYGPWGRPDMALYMFTQAIFEDRPISVFNHGRMRRDFTYVDDIVEALVRLIDVVARPDANFDPLHPDPGTSQAPYRVFNIGNNRPEELSHFIEVLERCIGRPAKRNYMDLQPGDVVETFADVSELEQWIDFRPSTPIETGVERFVRWYRDYHGVA